MKDTTTSTLIDQKKPGPKTVISGAIHGDERLGIEVIDYLKDALQNEDVFGQILLTIGNIEAYRQNTRFIDEDLNRLWSLKKIDEIQKKTTRNTEESRLLEILPLIENTDYLLDIHCTGKPSPYSFVYCENTDQHLALAQTLQTDYILSPESYNCLNTMDACFDNYIDATDGIGITIEAGWINDTNLFPKTIKGIKRALGHIGNVPAWQDKGDSPQLNQLVIFTEVIADSEQFKLGDDIQNFTFFKQHQTFAFDQDKPVTTPEDCYVIFPKRDIQAGFAACYLARKKT